MWQRLSERARMVVYYAQEEAGQLGTTWVSTEHLLLGLARESDSVAGTILSRIGLTSDQIRGAVMQRVSPGDAKLGPDMQLTPEAKRAIDLAYDEARIVRDNYIGTEHLLFGAIRERNGLGGRVLIELGVTLDRARAEMIALRQGVQGPTWPPAPKGVGQASTIDPVTTASDRLQMPRGITAAGYLILFLSVIAGMFMSARPPHLRLMGLITLLVYNRWYLMIIEALGVVAIYGVLEARRSFDLRHLGRHEIGMAIGLMIAAGVIYLLVIP